jgi:hypothetical protein
MDTRPTGASQTDSTARIHRQALRHGDRVVNRVRRSSPNECDGSPCTIDRGSNMKAARIHRFGAPDVVVVEDVPRPAPAAGELLIRVAASGVGPWDALIREGKSKVAPAAYARLRLIRSDRRGRTGR